MLRSTLIAIAASIALGANGVRLLHAQAPADLAPPTLLNEEAEVLTRGPIHEAFAAPIESDPQPGLIVAVRPPDDIEELPPDVRPDDVSAQWIGGYWSFDEERNDFLWVSGVWRIPPPDRQWVPGYWAEAQGGFQRVSGFWAPTAVEEVVYYPQPPQSLETGPTSPQPGPDFFWVPGQWIYRDRYIWQPGYWAAMQPQYTWVPSSYGWTPGGYVHTVGYWDLPPIDRGCMFAPVYFHGGVYRRPNFFYSPTVIIRLEQVLVHLFARPAYRSYYFGDYYGSNYANVGFVPWYASGARTRWSDPIYTAQYQRYGRNDPNWSRQYRERYDFLTANADARPRRTFSEQQRDLDRRDERSRNDFRLAGSIREIATDQDLGRRLTRIDDGERRGAQQRARSLDDFARRRGELETSARADASVGRNPPVGDGRNVGPGGLDPRNVGPGGPGSRSGERADGPRAPSLKLPEISAEARARAEARGRAPDAPSSRAGGVPNPAAIGGDRRGNAEPGDANPRGPAGRPDRPDVTGSPTAPSPTSPTATTPGTAPMLPGLGQTPPLPSDRTTRTPNEPARPNEPGRPNVPGRSGELGRPGGSGVPVPGTTVPGTTVPGTTVPDNTAPGNTTTAPMPGLGQPTTPGAIPRFPGAGRGPSTPTAPSAPSPNEPGRPGPRTLPAPAPSAPGPATGTAPTTPAPSRPSFGIPRSGNGPSGPDNRPGRFDPRRPSGNVAPPAATTPPAATRPAPQTTPAPAPSAPGPATGTAPSTPAPSRPSFGIPRSGNGSSGPDNRSGRGDPRRPSGNVAPPAATTPPAATRPAPQTTPAPRSTFNPGRGPSAPDRSNPPSAGRGAPQADRPQSKPAEARPPETRSAPEPKADRGPSGNRPKPESPPKSDSKPDDEKKKKKDK